MISLAVFAGLAAYAALLGWLIARLILRREARPGAPSAPRGMSIIIPFRNEAHRLGSLLASLAGQRYAGEWEVILVNDGSDDDFRNAITPFVNKFPVPLSVVDSAFDPAVRLTSKQQALESGVAFARHDWLLFTDADMAFEKDWLASWHAAAAPGCDLVFGHTKIANTPGGPFCAMQRFQLEFLFATAYAFHGAGIGGSCMGNNLLIKKSSYRRVGGQRGIGYSIVEDRDLYAAFRRRGMSVAPAEPFSARALTYPCDSFGRFYHQMLRWARGGFSPGSPLLWAGLLLTLQNAAFVVAVAGILSPAATVIAFVNFVLTMAFAALGFRKIGSRESAFFFPAYYLCMLAETAVIILSFFLTPKVVWKRRNV
jgi:cellulose synthase/poly-beta-1,6-N-acetylglucosamine synthase-like glycosyltransferase